MCISLPSSLFSHFRFISVEFSHSVVSDSWQSHGLQTPGLPVHHQLPEFTQTHVHRVGDATQPSHPLSSPLLPPSIFPSIRVFSNESVWLGISPGGSTYTMETGRRYKPRASCQHSPAQHCSPHAHVHSSRGSYQQDVRRCSVLRRVTRG